MSQIETAERIRRIAEKWPFTPDAKAALLAGAEAIEAVEVAREALKAVQTMRDTKQPRKLDEALTWRENDAKADELYAAALARLEAL